MLRTVALFIFIISFQQAYCQNHTISGYVEDINTGERIIGAYVYEIATKSITQTNNYGHYSFKITGNEPSLQATYTGFKSEIYKLNLKHDTIITIQMQPVKELKEVNITSMIFKRTVNSALSFNTIPVKSLTSLPALGEPDLIKSIQSQPGIKGGVEGSTGIFVRGGSSGENLFMLDDVPLYNVSHLYGFFSTFNSSAIKDIKLYKGCFPARYGGRASSVIDVRSLDGNNKSIKGEASIGLISSKFTIEGPLINEKSTFIISGRRSYFDLYSGILKSLDILDLNFPGYYFYDLNIRLSHTFSPKDKIFISFYKGKDKIQYKGENHLTNTNSEKFSDSSNEISGWGNLIGSLRWNHTIGNKLFINTTIAYSRYNFFIQSNYNNIQGDSEHSEVLEETYSASYKSDVSDLIIKTDCDFSISNIHKLTFGAGNTFHEFNPGSNIYSMSNKELNINIDTSFINITINNSGPFLYLEDEMDLNQKLIIRTGLRLSGIISGNKLITNFEPRVSANYAVSSRFSIKTGYSRMVQYLHLLSSSGLSMPTDIWVPAAKGVYPLKSDQINSGISYDWNNIILISMEIYRKWLNNTADYRNGASLLSDISPWYEKITQGHGNAQGLEVSLEKQEGVLTGSINYTYSKAVREYQNLNNGNEFPFKYDRRHDMNVSINYRISKKWDISALWWFGTGYPVTIPVEKYYPALSIVKGTLANFNNLVYYYPSLNNYRLPAYHRLDLGLHYKTQLKIGEQILSIDVFNAYNHKNAVNMYYLQNYTFKSVYLFPIIPSITYTIKF